VESKELGIWNYPLDLQALNPLPDPPLHFKIQLGDSQKQILTLTNYFQNQTQYKCKVQQKGGNTFTCADQISIDGSTQFQIEVVYEPMKVTKTEVATLEVFSEEGGRFEVILIGQCLPPTPKGPISIQHPSHTIPFKNIFPTEEEFQINIDNPCFKLKASLKQLKSKEEGSIVVERTQEGAQRAQMVVLNKRHEIQWIFYLQTTP